MLRGGRVRFAEGMVPRLTRSYTNDGCGWLRERRAIWVGAGHWRFLMEQKMLLIEHVAESITDYLCVHQVWST